MLYLSCQVCNHLPYKIVLLPLARERSVTKHLGKFLFPESLDSPGWQHQVIKAVYYLRGNLRPGYILGQELLAENLGGLLYLNEKTWQEAEKGSNLSQVAESRTHC